MAEVAYFCAILHLQEEKKALESMSTFIFCICPPTSEYTMVISTASWLGTPKLHEPISLVHPLAK